MRNMELGKIKTSGMQNCREIIIFLISGKIYKTKKQKDRVVLTEGFKRLLYAELGLLTKNNLGEKR